MVCVWFDTFWTPKIYFYWHLLSTSDCGWRFIFFSVYLVCNTKGDKWVKFCLQTVWLWKSRKKEKRTFETIFLTVLSTSKVIFWTIKLSDSEIWNCVASSLMKQEVYFKKYMLLLLSSQYYVEVQEAHKIMDKNLHELFL